MISTLQANKEQQGNATVSKEQSHTLMKNLLRTAISTICYCRNLFPDEVFKKKKLAGLKVQTLRGDLDREANMLVRWMEHGVFDALKKQFLDSIVFAIYAGETDELLECYTFKMSYPDGEDEAHVGLHVTKQIKNKIETSAFVKDSTTSKQEVKRATVTMIRTLITLAPTLKTIPENRYLSMRLLYRDEYVPDDYQPKHFKPEEETTNLFFRQQPFKVKIGKVTTEHHEMSMHVKTLVEHDDDDGLMCEPTNMLDGEGMEEDEAMMEDHGAEDNHIQQSHHQSSRHPVDVNGVTQDGHQQQASQLSCDDDATTCTQPDERSVSDQHSTAFVRDSNGEFGTQEVVKILQTFEKSVFARSTSQDDFAPFQQQPAPKSTTTTNGSIGRPGMLTPLNLLPEAILPQQLQSPHKSEANRSGDLDRFFMLAKTKMQEKSYHCGPVHPAEAKSALLKMFPLLSLSDVTGMLKKLIEEKVVAAGGGEHPRAGPAAHHHHQQQLQQVIGGKDVVVGYPFFRRHILSTKCTVISKLQVVLDISANKVKDFMNQAAQEGIVKAGKNGRFIFVGSVRNVKPATGKNTSAVTAVSTPQPSFGVLGMPRAESNKENAGPAGAGGACFGKDLKRKKAVDPYDYDKTECPLDVMTTAAKSKKRRSFVVESPIRQNKRYCR